MESCNQGELLWDLGRDVQGTHITIRSELASAIVCIVDNATSTPVFKNRVLILQSKLASEFL